VGYAAKLYGLIHPATMRDENPAGNRQELRGIKENEKTLDE
jgi:hypothetical protein